MNVALIVDKVGSAIYRLSDSIKRHNPHINISIYPLHPKRPDAEQIENATKGVMDADLVHIGYWRSGEKLKEFYDFSTKPKILCHYNPYDAKDNEINDEYEHIVVGNSTINNDLPKAELIHYGIDLDKFIFNENYTRKKTVLMVVARIEGKKGIVEVAEVCKKLDYKFVLVGRISKPEYFKQIIEVNPNTEFREDVTEEELVKAYHEAAVHVCNSQDDFESGTLPILESMATGVPVLTRNIGHVPDLYNGANMVVRNGMAEDVEDLTNELRDLMENKGQRDAMRENAWDTVRNWGDERMAWRFGRLYYRVLAGEMPFVSIIIPTYDRPDILMKSLARAAVQDYPAYEIVVSDSGKDSVEALVKEFAKQVWPPIKYVRFRNEGIYTLAEARNRAVIESQGDLLVFCDERIGLERNTVTQFVNRHDKKMWQWGIKDGAKKGFVENLSCISREDLIKHGMFNERINVYGGMSEEIRTRFEGRNGFQLAINQHAHAVSLGRANSKRGRRDKIRKAKMILYKMYS